jgi:hypothetical protein
MSAMDKCRVLLRRSVVLVAFVLIACDEARYKGDGKLTDDRFSPSQRFVLALGPIDMSRSGVHTFRLAGLPTKDFALGFQVSGPRPANEPLYDSRPLSPVVKMTLTDETGRIVVDESRPLNDWVWSGSPHESTSFVYLQGLTRDVPVSDGVVSPQPIGMKPDAGWGSSFTPRPDGSYVLRLEILAGDPRSQKYAIEVKGVTGGWE